MKPSTQANGEEGGTQEAVTRSLLLQGIGVLISSHCCHKSVQARCLSNTDSLSSRIKGWKSTIGSPEKRPRGWQDYTASSMQDVAQEPIPILHLPRRKPFYQQLELVLAEARLFRPLHLQLHPFFLSHWLLLIPPPHTGGLWAQPGDLVASLALLPTTPECSYGQMHRLQFY